ncbi:hypothetical protein ASF49_11380 [Methylobacterium sp. Leaf104]|uniref:DUF6925 family protein n=1 Tax=Methylobacterium TaxID=407 RepID=UPI0006F20A02|nr:MULTISPECIES: hypothetical protein [Methylobacterium]KQP31168.1 hypothetical protein ASF49_11380 [Methylobacterium sp. Leaf104]MCI9881260.1 hypothetical protein [Methylobacterium goesingense]
MIATALADPETTWTMGGFGALARFCRDPDAGAGAPAGGRLGLVTPRGGIALDPADAIPLAYETAFAGGWSHAVALCLPAGRCPRIGPGSIRAAGRDAAALRPRNLGDKWFDLGLALPQGRMFLRSADPDTLARLAKLVGHAWTEDPVGTLDLLAVADVVVTTPLGRIEVLAGTGTEPGGPRAFLDPKILALGRTHAATAPIPRGLVPVAQFVPPHPCRDREGRARPFDPAAHAAFQAVLARWGDPALVRLKAQQVAGAPPSAKGATRFTRGIGRVIQLQAEARANQDSPKSSPDTPR